MNGEEVRESFGDYLIRERESRNITAEDMARATRLSVHFIEALEHNDFDLISQKESIPGFLKLYARHLPLNYEYVLKRYQIEDEYLLKKRLHKRWPFSNDPAPAIAPPKEKGTSFKPGRWPFPAAFAAVAVVIALSTYVSSGKAPQPTVPGSVKYFATAYDIQPLQSSQIKLVLSNAPSASDSSSTPEKIDSHAPSQSVQREAPVPVPSAVAAKEKIVVVGNSDSKRYHLPGMRYYHEVKAYHRVQFASEEEAVRAGYVKARG